MPHHDHDHNPTINAANCNAVGLAALITGAFMGVELMGGIISGSLALIADAGHMLTDFAALALAWAAFWLSNHSAHKAIGASQRLPLYAAAINCISLFIISAWILWEAYHRFQDPVPIIGPIMFIIALGGLIVNLIILKILAKADGKNLNIKAANMHVMGDLLGSIAAIIAAIAIMVTGWTPIDPLLSTLVALLIARGAWSIGKETLHALRHNH